MRLLGFLVVTSCIAAPVSAQPGWFDLAVPSAALTQLEVRLDEGRALAMPRAIRQLHTNPREGELPAHLVEFERFLTDLDAVENESLRAGGRGLSLAMAKSSTERDVLKSAVETMGFQLRERRGVYAVEPSGDGDAAKRRKRLDAAGIDTAAIEKALNDGETVKPAQVVTMLPSPLPHEVWESAIFERKIPPHSLFSAIARDRRASLLFYGLLSMPGASRAYLAREPGLLQRLYREVAGTVAAFGGCLRVGDDGRLIVPGGAEAVELWEAVADARLEQPGGRFVHAIFSRSEGRLAYLFDAIAHLDAPHQRFALGLWIKDRGVRLERFRALSHAFAEVDPTWIVPERPFSRPLYDPATMLALVEVGPHGEPLPPHYRRFWDRALASIDLPSAGTRELKSVTEDGLVDAAWLAEHLLHGLFPERQPRLGCFTFGQRVFGSAREEDLEDILVAIRACSRYPGLVMTLERAGVRRPATYAQAARRALEIENVGNAVEAVPLLTQFQGTLVLLERMSRTGAIATTEIDGLVASLCAVTPSGGRYEGALAVWFETTLFPALPLPGESNWPLESRLLWALADTAEASAPFEWEGSRYVADVTGVSLRELVATRAKQGGNGIDAVMALSRALAVLRQKGLTLDALKTHTVALKTAGDALASARAWPDIPDNVPDVKKSVDRAVRDLNKIAKPNDVAKVPRTITPLAELVDYLLGETIVALTYAPHLGDPRDLLGPESDESHRHNFGLTSKPGAPAVARRAWQRPAVDSAAKDGRALSGSLFGLDLTLSRKRLRRLALDGIPRPPRINSNDSAALVDTLALFNPRTLTSDDLATVGKSIARGREEVRAATDAPSLDRLAERASMSEVRRELLGWTLQHEPARVPALFSTSELFWLGLGDRPFERLDSWGTSFEPQTGCYCLRFPAAGMWDRAAGRLGSRLLGTALPDLSLRVVEHLAALKVPAAVFPGVMAMATQDFIDDASPIFDDDWVGIVGYAGQMSQETVQDYVAAVVAAGPVRRAKEAQ